MVQGVAPLTFSFQEKSRVRVDCLLKLPRSTLHAYPVCMKTHFAKLEKWSMKHHGWCHCLPAGTSPSKSKHLDLSLPPHLGVQVPLWVSTCVPVEEPVFQHWGICKGTCLKQVASFKMHLAGGIGNTILNLLTRNTKLCSRCHSSEP